MKAVLEKKVKLLEIKKKLLDGSQAVTDEETALRRVATKSQQITKAREYYAASKIQAIVKGYLDRLLCTRKRRHLRTVKLIQRIFLGKLGRMRWKREYWRSISVVKSDTALEEIRSRSTKLRETVLQGRGGYRWQEYFDPLTESFWYYNSVTKHNTWHVPLEFQKDLVCHWEGYREHGGMPHTKPCRCAFDTIDAYRNHVRFAHAWYCVACLQKNTGIVFPTCFLCGNRYNEDGIDGEQAIKNSVHKVRRQLEHFLAKDVTAKDKGLYNIKDRLIALAQEREVAISAMEQYKLDLAYTLNESGENEKTALLRKQMVAVNEAYLNHALNSSGQNAALGNNVIAGMSNALFQPPPTPTHTQSTPTHKQGHKGAQKHPVSPHHSSSAGAADSTDNCSAQKQSGIPTYTQTIPLSTAFENQQDDENCAENEPENSYSTVNAAFQARLEEKNGGLEGEKERFRHPNTKGILNDVDFELFMKIHDDDVSSNMALNLYNSDSDDESSVSSVQSLEVHSNVNAKGAVAVKKAEKVTKHKLTVCPLFLQNKCSLSTCPLAHPGIRDSARPKMKTVRNADGTKTSTPFVYICPHSTPMYCNCASKAECRDYHVYIRPSTQDIILAIYPIFTGRKSKQFGTAKLVGNVYKSEFTGYGVMTWRNGSTYMGDWSHSMRHGWGMYRSRDGSEYIGAFKEGLRHGWGVQSNVNGDEYVGQWHMGKMEGVGALQCRNGDVYEGSFVNNLYDGIGSFRKATGDLYMGHCKLGMAHGLGILSCRNGEKYKGHFDRNTRHGKGACAYPNGARYFGMWYRGAHQGNGIYLSPSGEKYVGSWAGGKKEGTGRYSFKNGDFYDGQFHKNKAQGLGVYYHANGNIFTGQWENDRRNGKGTYVFSNGSRYTGHWNENDIHIKGRFDFANGCHFRGEFKRNKKDGKGIFCWPSGNVYKGEFRQEKMCGKGEMSYATGHRYVGEWADNKKNGNGTFYYHTGAVYEGHFVDDQRQGFGKITFMAGSAVEESYEGQWEADEWHGHGVYRYRKEEGTVYEGDWVHGVRDGHGKITFKDGSFYKGEMQKNQMWGHGIFVGSDNSQYDGEWRANMRQGMGTALYEDGSIYHGEFWGNMKQGHGRLQRPDGSVYSGTWDANIIVGAGKVTIQVGNREKRDGLPKELTLKVFGY